MKTRIVLRKGNSIFPFLARLLKCLISVKSKPLSISIKYFFSLPSLNFPCFCCLILSPFPNPLVRWWEVLQVGVVGHFLPAVMRRCSLLVWKLPGPGCNHHSLSHTLCQTEQNFAVLTLQSHQLGPGLPPCCSQLKVSSPTVRIGEETSHTYEEVADTTLILKRRGNVESPGIKKV